MSIFETYEHKLARDVFNDIKPRMPDLLRYGKECETVVEFGVRSGNSTVAFLAGGAKVTSYDLAGHTFDCPDDAKDRWTFIQASTLDLASIPECDALFIDTIHHRKQVTAELRFARYAKKYLLFHDVFEWGWKGEEGQEGINFAIWNFLMEHPEWRVKECLRDQWGLLVLQKTN